jgi:ABC-type multidrug transport system fused ATPase/permease subunit
MWVGRVCHSVRSLYRGMGKLSTPARALLQGAAVLILDESFAALDPATLHRVQPCVLAHAPTLLVIAHP